MFVYGIVFVVVLQLFMVFIVFVVGDYYYGLYVGGVLYGFQYVYGVYDIGCVVVYWVGIGVLYQCLGCKMKYYVRLYGCYGLCQMYWVVYIVGGGLYVVVQLGQFEQVGMGWCGQ